MTLDLENACQRDREEAIRVMWVRGWDTAAIACTMGAGFLGKTESRCVTDGARIEAMVERVVHKLMHAKAVQRGIEKLRPVKDGEIPLNP